MMLSKIFARVISPALALALAAPPALAHHGWAGQGTETFELSGTVHTALTLGGPHATMRIQDKNGQIWDLTLSSPARTEAAGLKQGVIPVGATVTISGKRSRDSNRFEVKTERVTHAGKNYDVYPNRTS
jgi:hypothetical protein